MGDEAPPAASSTAFPIVGIGASAGGLEALEQFLGGVPARNGMAFVVVQHLDPTRKGLMPELLQRATEMKVIQVKDRMRVRPNSVYVIPPGKEMSILRGVLHLFAPTEARGLRLPIDSFLRSLALDLPHQCIGVVLSGMGSDGTLGLRAIKEAGGVVLVQDPTTAKFDGMPRSAIDAGLADIVAPAEELPARIVAFLARTPLAGSADAPADAGLRSALDKTLLLLRAHSGHDFTLYKKNMLYRRIERRMGIHRIRKMGDYVRYVRENPQELDLLFKELLIGVTSFFRDPPAWDQLRDHVLPALIEARPAGVLRAWVAGCSTGEEAYSLAIVFREALDSVKPSGPHSLQIFATDLDRDAIDKARTGVFPENVAADISPERLSRFFSRADGGYRVRAQIRETVVFAPHDLIMDPSFTRLDLLTCRNLLIYLAPETQKKLLPLFHYSLQPDGVLFLGSAETVGGFSDLFEPLGGKTRIFRRRQSAPSAEPIRFPASFAAAVPDSRDRTATRPGQRSGQSFQTTVEQFVLHRLAPPAVIANDQGNILYVSGKTGRYLEPAAGKANWNVFAMARHGLDQDVATAFREALRKPGPVTVRGLEIGADAAGRRVDVTVERLDDPEALRGLVMVVFADVAAPPEPTAGRPRKASARGSRAAALEGELRRVRAELQSTREGMQTSQEELKSTNEEMQSTNEELQSTNEELTTSKEEMQSMNEELQTVNHELQIKVDELSRSSSDMKNLLESTDIATLFLDPEMRVRRYTAPATKIIQLIPGDVGRPITDLSSSLDYPRLAHDAGEVLRTLASTETPVAARDGRWFAVRIMPYRTLDDRIDGVVITFANITVAKTLEAELREKQAALERILAGRPGDATTISTKSARAKPVRPTTARANATPDEPRPGPARKTAKRRGRAAGGT